MRSPRPCHRSPWTTCIMWILSAWWRLVEGHKRGDILAMFLGCEAVGVAPSPQGQAGGEAEVSPRGRPASEKRGSQPAWRAEVREPGTAVSRCVVVEAARGGCRGLSRNGLCPVLSKKAKKLTRAGNEKTFPLGQ